MTKIPSKIQKRPRNIQKNPPKMPHEIFFVVGNFENFVKNFGQNISKFRSKNFEILKNKFRNFVQFFIFKIQK
jgi:UDP-2,3-diacylglucosamine pyrophosphatase LpxH